MTPDAYRSMARQEGRNWYYRARRRAIWTLIERYIWPQAGGSPAKRPRILDIGCGTGGTTALLADFGEVTGVEPSDLAIQLCRESHPQLHVVQGRLQDLPFLVPLGTFDLVTVLGVLCHKDVSDPRAGLETIGLCLKPGGWILWGDCVYPCLAREHDEFVHAVRRFYPRQMHRMLEDAGFGVVSSTPMLGWAFAVALGLAWAHRLKRRWGRAERTARPRQWTDDRPLPGPLNAALESLTYWEWRLSLWGLKMPVGVSRLVLAQKLPRPAAGVSREAA